MTIAEIEQQPILPGFYDIRDQLRRHIYARSETAFAKGDAARDAISAPRALSQRQRKIQSSFISCLGGLPSRVTALKSRITGIVSGDGFRIEKVIFESRPKTFVTANLYLPDDRRGRRGAVLFLSGHDLTAKTTGCYQEICQMFVRAGLVVLSLDPIGQGERLSYYEAPLKTSTIIGTSREHEYAGVQCHPLGDSIARYFLHDTMRGIDYLVSRPEVDPARIGATGASGGGMQTLMLMMADPRLAAAAPCCNLTNRRAYMWSGGAQDAEQIWPGFTTAGFDHEDYLIAFAPKPVCVLAAQYDFFPIEGTRRTVDRCRRFWKMFRQDMRLKLFEEKIGHGFSPQMARVATEFFSRHLLGRQPGKRDLSVAAFEESKLWCTRSGQVRGEIKGARAVHEANGQRLKELEKHRRSQPSARRRQRALSWLRQRVFAQRKPSELNPRFYWKESWGGLAAEFAYWWSQEGLINHGILFRSHEDRGKTLPVTVAVWDGGTSILQPRLAWIGDECRRRRAVLVLDVSGVGALTPHSLQPYPANDFFGVIHKFQDDLTWLDDDLVALRTFDVLRSLDLILQWPSLDARDIRVYGQGKQGLYAQLAAALDRRVNRVEIVDGMGSFTDLVQARYYDSFNVKSVILRGVLRHFDLPDLVKWRK